MFWDYLFCSLENKRAKGKRVRIDACLDEEKLLLPGAVGEKIKEFNIFFMVTDNSLEHAHPGNCATAWEGKGSGFIFQDRTVKLAFQLLWICKAIVALLLEKKREQTVVLMLHAKKGKKDGKTPLYT